MVARTIPVDEFDLVVLGATGDLARRKILPGLYRRMSSGQMPQGARIIGAARSDLDDAGFQTLVREALETFLPAAERSEACDTAFFAALGYVQIDATGEGGWDALKARMRPDVVRAFYFSVGPSLFGSLASRLKSHGISTPESRIVVEKPFGTDLPSAQALNTELAQYFDETQIYRIDHYLGKETVQNLMAVRFGMSSLSPSGTPNTWTMCRSPWPRPWAWGGVGNTTTAQAPCETWFKTT